MEARYNPKNIETSLFKFWQDNHLFVPSEDEKNNKQRKSYSVLMPPPNVTNVLHLGHALNNTLQDVMVRYHRMQGFNTIWKIGVDHAGIATQNMVEKELLKEGITREQLGKEEFVKRVWDWKHKYGSTILDQLKRLGVSGDWEHDRFTLDDVSSKAVKEIFVQLYNDKLIYRGEYIINWCVQCLTTISDDEVEHVDHNGNIYTVKYFLEDGTYLFVATTRPETILGDVALAVHPEDMRYQKYIGQKAKVPNVDRWIPIIGDESVEIDFGTGVLKVTPFHDPTDFIIGQKHKLPFIEVIDQYGKMNHSAGENKGVDRFEFRKIFVQQLKALDLLEEIKPHNHARGTCYRCHQVIEPRISTQWFVKMDSLAKPAKTAMDEGKVKFTPDKWEKVYHHWMDNIKDWSISRQLWWGHSIPAYHCQDCKYITVAIDISSECEKCKSKNITPDPDVLDTWFSSWIWPFTVFGCSDFTKENWKTPEFEQFYPTQYLATAPEIIFFWVARMIMAGLYLTGEVPFKEVFFNSTVCDIQGRKMSKSLGNGIDPMDIIEEHGADALRFTLLFMAPKGERIRLDSKSFDVGSRLVTKLWNAARLIFMQRPEGLTSLENIEDLKITRQFQLQFFSQYEYIVKQAQKALEEFDYHKLTHIVYDFFWHDFCDWFLERTKADFKIANEQEKKRLYFILESALDRILRLFHPIMPFITEAIWQELIIPKTSNSIMRASYDKIKESEKIFLDDEAVNQDKEQEGDDSLAFREFIEKLRKIKKDWFNLSDKDEISLYFEIKQTQKIHLSHQFKNTLHHFTQSQFLTLKNNKEEYLLISFHQYNIYIQIPSNIDIKELKQKMQKRIQYLQDEINRANNNIDNPKLPEEKKEEEEKKISIFNIEYEDINLFLQNLGGENV